MILIAVAALVALVLALLGGVVHIDFLKKKMYKQYVLDEAPESHKVKNGTPTTGGVFLVVAAYHGDNVFVAFLIERCLVAFFIEIDKGHRVDGLLLFFRWTGDVDFLVGCDVGPLGFAIIPHHTSRYFCKELVALYIDCARGLA